MSRELLIYANPEVALRYKQKMERSFRIYLSIAAGVLALILITDISPFLFCFIAAIFLCLAGLSFNSRNSMVEDAEAGLLMFRFTPEGWYRNEGPVLYRWEDFKRVEFLDRAVKFSEENKASKTRNHNIVGAEISPMLMTDTDYDKAERWIREHLPDHLKS